MFIARWIVLRATACLMCWLMVLLFAPALRAQDYPVVFYSAAKLRELGIALSFGHHVPPLKNRCFYYGDGGYLISTSDAFYERFRQRGFSVEAMCFGLVSETHYDPESGQKLPTYILVDKEQMDENMRQYGKVIEPGVVTDELPLDLPDCFKNGNPYSDCQFRFGRKTGKPLTADQTAIYKRLGARLDQTMGKAPESVGSIKFFGEDEQYVKGFRKTDGYNLSQDLPDELQRYSSASIWANSNKLPRGYGYGMDADGAAGPDVNAAALEIAIRGLMKPQVDVRTLIQSLTAGK